MVYVLPLGILQMGSRDEKHPREVFSADKRRLKFLEMNRSNRFSTPQDIAEGQSDDTLSNHM